MVSVVRFFCFMHQRFALTGVNRVLQAVISLPVKVWSGESPVILVASLQCFLVTDHVEARYACEKQVKNNSP